MEILIFLLLNLVDFFQLCMMFLFKGLRIQMTVLNFLNLLAVKLTFSLLVKGCVIFNLNKCKTKSAKHLFPSRELIKKLQ